MRKILIAVSVLILSVGYARSEGIRYANPPGVASSGFDSASTPAAITTAWTFAGSSLTVVAQSTFSGKVTMTGAVASPVLHVYSTPDGIVETAKFEHRPANTAASHENRVVIENYGGSYSSYESLVFRDQKSGPLTWEHYISAKSKALLIGYTSMSGSPTNPSIYIIPDGINNAAPPFVGINTNSPTSRFHVVGGSITVSGAKARLSVLAPAGVMDDAILQVSTGTSRLFAVYSSSVNIGVPLYQNVPGADHVFEPDYKHMSIDECVDFTSTQKHLPGFPDAEETSRTDTATLITKTIEKLEEAHLYIFELQKQIHVLEKRIEKLEKK